MLSWKHTPHYVALGCAVVGLVVSAAGETTRAGTGAATWATASAGADMREGLRVLDLSGRSGLNDPGKGRLRMIRSLSEA